MVSFQNEEQPVIDDDELKDEFDLDEVLDIHDLIMSLSEAYLELNSKFDLDSVHKIIIQNFVYFQFTVTYFQYFTC